MTVPLVINAAALWGVGLGGGYRLAFGDGAALPAALHGARGFWAAATFGLVLTALALAVFQLRVARAFRPAPAAPA